MSEQETRDPSKKKIFSISILWKPKFIKDWAQIISEEGFRGLIRRKGLIFLLAFVTFYAIRDTFLYIIIPYLVLKGIITCK